MLYALVGLFADGVVPDCVDGEHLVGLSMAYDGSLVFATSAGRVGAVSQDFARAAPMLQLPGRDVAKLPLKMISNNFAIDQVSTATDELP